MIIDAKDKILGRLAVFAAKKALSGEEVTIINAEKVIISGSRDEVFSRFRVRRERGDSIHGPHYPRMPDKIVRRTIRGMIPTKKPSGKIAYKKVKVYIGSPENMKADSVEINGRESLKNQKCVVLEDVCEWLGARWK